MGGEVVISGRFNGPQSSGNGGYSAGVIAGLLGGPAQVSLRAPVPLDRPLSVHEGEAEVRLMDGETLIAEGRLEPDFDIDVPPPIGVDEARRAAARYRGLADGMFSRCFVCGRAREDALEVFAGVVEGRGLVASPWTPPSWTAANGVAVREEIVWAVLDCPTYFALYADGELPVSFLARLTARVDGPVTPNAEHVVMAWPLERDGRKHHAGCAVIGPDGEVLARAHALLIEARA